MKKFFCWLGWHKWFDFAYGYPAFSQHFTFQECRWCKVKRRYTRLLGEPRPKSFVEYKHYINRCD